MTQTNFFYLNYAAFFSGEFNFLSIETCLVSYLWEFPSKNLKESKVIKNMKYNTELTTYKKSKIVTWELLHYVELKLGTPKTSTLHNISVFENSQATLPDQSSQKPL